MSSATSMSLSIRARSVATISTRIASFWRTPSFVMARYASVLCVAVGVITVFPFGLVGDVDKFIKGVWQGCYPLRTLYDFFECALNECSCLFVFNSEAHLEPHCDWGKNCDDCDHLLFGKCCGDLCGHWTAFRVSRYGVSVTIRCVKVSGGCPCLEYPLILSRGCVTV